MKRPECTIVIPVFNRWALTRACLESLSRHCEADLAEILVVDNGSSDETSNELARWSARGLGRVIRNARNLGFARACNQGAIAATGRQLVMLNNDTEVEAGWLTALLAPLDGDHSIGAVGAKLLYPDRTIQHAGVIVVDHRPQQDPLLALHIYRKLPSDHPPANRRRRYRAVTAACMAIRREAWEATGGFDPGYWNGYEDVDLCFMLGALGWHVVYEPASVVIHHESQSGPERWSAAPANIRRLHGKWLGKITPDAVVPMRAPDYLPVEVGCAST
jgi:GT2 family glycosyltransferase